MFEVLIERADLFLGLLPLGIEREDLHKPSVEAPGKPGHDAQEEKPHRSYRDVEPVSYEEEPYDDRKTRGQGEDKKGRTACGMNGCSAGDHAGQCQAQEGLMFK